jgi:hypothetical protein
MPDDAPTIGLRIVDSLAAVDAAQWDACALAPGSGGNPFLSYRFLKALEDSKSVGRRTGWQPQYLVAESDDGTLHGAAPLYMKSHSQGEYVFDHGWAQALERAGGRYYPKLQVAVPFTPVPGPRLFARPGPMADAVRDALIDMLAKIANDNNISSVHATFCTEEEWKRFGDRGWLLRLGQQYHWSNDGYRTFDDFLGALSSRKRKAIRKEREAVRREGLVIHTLTGVAEQQLLGQRLLDVLLDDAASGRAPILLVVARSASHLRGFGLRQLDGDVAVGQLGFQLQDELLDHLMITSRAEAERDDRVEAVAELRREQALDRLLYPRPRACRGRSRWRLGLSAAPAFVVMIRITLRKSTFLPLWSVSLPWSITCTGC